MANAKKAYRGPQYRRRVLSLLEQYRDILVFDFETTGLGPKKDRITEVAAIKYHLDEGNLMQEVSRLHLYIRPPFMVEDKVVKLTGITNEFLSTCPWEEEVVEKIFDFFGAGPLLVCGQNVKFDTSFLVQLYERYGRPMISSYTEIDTLEMARDIFPEEKSHKLIDIARLCGIADGVSFHSAIEDVQVTAKVFWILWWNYIAKEEDVRTGAIVEDPVDNIAQTEPIEANPPLEKKRPSIFSYSYWTMTAATGQLRRVYVNTSIGSIYYDGRKHAWQHKDPKVDLDTIDMEYVENVCLSHERCTTADQFLKKMEQVGKRYIA